MADYSRHPAGKPARLLRLVATLALIGAGAGANTAGCANAEITTGRFDAGALAADASDGVEGETGPAANPLPVLTSLSPSEAEVGGTGPSVAVKGSSFVQASVVRVNGNAVATTYVSDTELSAKIADALLASAGTLQVTVFTGAAARGDGGGGGGGGESSALAFNVVNPVPTLTQLAPTSALAGASGVTLTLTGAKFVSGSIATFDGTDLATTFVDNTTLTAAIPAANLLATGSFPVTVRSPTPGGGTTQSIAFTVANPSVTIAGISPGYATAGDPNTSLIVSGSGFVSGSVVNFNGKALPTSYVSSTRVDTVIQASSLTLAGSFPVTVTNPAPGGGTSAPASFEVRYPAPKITVINPSTAAAGSAALTITVTGTGFVSSQSQIQIDNLPTATTFVSTTQLKATIPGSSLATAGTLSIKVVTASPGGGTSEVVTFTVTNPAPTITTVSPTTIVQGSAQTTLTVDGTGFNSGSRVRANATSLTTTYVSAIKLTAIVPTSTLAATGTLAITVLNAAPGGGTSNAASISVGCDTTGVDVQLAALGDSYTLFPTYDTNPAVARLKAGTCPITLSTTTQASRMVIVQNTSSAAATLSTWATCTGTANYDSFLTVYRRATRPSTAAEREACTGVVSEGKSGGVAAAISPESGASNWCPGLTKGNGYGVTIGICERLVVHIQPYSTTSTTFPPPPSFKVKIE
jgi:hypothetical protein